MYCILNEVSCNFVYFAPQLLILMKHIPLVRQMDVMLRQTFNRSRSVLHSVRRQNSDALPRVSSLFAGLKKEDFSDGFKWNQTVVDIYAEIMWMLVLLGAVAPDFTRKLCGY